ncbi:hypothetical protein H6P81_002447 [Aristolochia fimbriata]|uniref:Uncharacterized protein n=1 Tax=Aristolochia fimbriata TaxID=158543 RepID=A0AAV7FBG5_ARIFI|nr:hypothetical protein H6P81_002447 [Aristolochia fimbriata]
MDPEPHSTLSIHWRARDVGVYGKADTRNITTLAKQHLTLECPDPKRFIWLLWIKGWSRGGPHFLSSSRSTAYIRIFIPIWTCLFDAGSGTKGMRMIIDGRIDGYRMMEWSEYIDPTYRTSKGGSATGFGLPRRRRHLSSVQLPGPSLITPIGEENQK